MPIFWRPPNIEQLAAQRKIRKLIKALRYKSASVRRAAATALGQLGTPQAIAPLIAALQDRDWGVRQASGTALFTIYRLARLDDAHKRRILAQRTTITQRHDDNSRHHDSGGYSDCSYSYYEHRDTGIGVDFPI